MTIQTPTFQLPGMLFAMLLTISLTGLISCSQEVEPPPPSVEAAPADNFDPQPPILAVSPLQQKQRFVLQPGYSMDPVLTEPDIMEPMQIAFDGNGRMFVMELRTYMQDIDGTDELTPQSRISLHEDTNNDGTYNRSTVFVDNLIVPRFVMPFGTNSILTMESNEDDVWLYTDTNGDGVADQREHFTSNYGRSANIEHQQSGLFWAMDNWLYSTHNSFRIRMTPDGVIRENTGSTGGGGVWGVTQDNYGKTYVQGGHDGVPRYYQFPVRYGTFEWDDRFTEGLEVPYGIAGVADYQGGENMSRPDGTLNRVTAGAGNDIVRAHRMPEDLQGDYLYGEPVGRIVRRLAMTDFGGLTQMHNVYQDEESEFIRSTDHLFRPVQMQSAPDGTVYIVDTYRGIIQQGNWTQEGSFLREKILQYELEKVISHGRIWRLSHEDLGRDTQRPRMNDETPAELVRHLEHENGWWRDTAQRLLVMHQDPSVAPALEEMARNSSSLYARFHALWTLEGLHALPASLVREKLSDPDPAMRIQAMRLSEILYKAGDHSFADDYKRLAGDEDHHVVIQSLLTLNYLDADETLEIARTTVEANDALGVQHVGNRIIELIENPPTPSFAGFNEEHRAMMERGMEIYRGLCSACHGNDGTGASAGPGGALLGTSLVSSPGILAHKDYVTKTMLHGLQGPNSIMVGMGMNDDEWIADVSSYIRNSFTNEAPLIHPEDVARVREAHPDRTSPWTYEEIHASIPVALEREPSWNITASHSAPMGVGSAPDPARAFTFEGWTTGESQQQGMWFQIELSEAENITEVEFSSPTQGGFGQPPRRTSPQTYRVDVSMNGSDWTQVAEGESDGAFFTSIHFEPAEARFVRITQTAETEENAPVWTMRRLKLYVAQ